MIIDKKANVWYNRKCVGTRCPIMEDQPQECVCLDRGGDCMCVRLNPPLREKRPWKRFSATETPFGEFTEVGAGILPLEDYLLFFSKLPQEVEKGEEA